MTVRKAVIPAAGLGTRFLPASKVVPKELLTLVDRPVIQYTIEELARAGFEQVCLVISKGKESIADHFLPAPRLEEALERSGKMDLLAETQRVNSLVEVTTVFQDEPLGLGHAVATARDWVGDEAFAVALPDEVYDPAGGCIEALRDAFQSVGSSVISVTAVDPEEIHLYGAVEVEQGDPPLKVRSVVEKPKREQARSSFASIGRYVLEPRIFEVIEDLPPGAGGEIQLADALGVLAEQDRLYAVPYEGRRWDVGKKSGYLAATVALAREHPELADSFLKALEES